MKNISPDLTKLIFDDLPKPLQDWWQPVADTDEETQFLLHRARISFTRAVMRLHDHSSQGLYLRLHPVGPRRVKFWKIREEVAQKRLREVERIPIDLPADPRAVAAVRQEIFPYLPSDLSRYMYLTLLRDIDRRRFDYPALREHFPPSKLHIAIVSLASRLAWKLCLIDQPTLLLRIRGCVQEMSGGSVENFMQWCRQTVEADAPFFDIDRVLRRCLILVTNELVFPSSDSGKKCDFM